MSTKPVWEQLENETLKGYDTFRAYLTERRPRMSLRKWCSINGVAYSTAALWKDQNNWQARIAAYDSWLDQAIDQERNKSLVLLQTQVIRDEVADYQLLQGTWRKAMEHVNRRIEKAEETGELDGDVFNQINTLAMARSRIDNMVRKSAQLPGVYAAKEGGEIPLGDDMDVMLDFDSGPTMIPGKVREVNNGGEIPAAAPVPDAGEDEHDEIQGSGSGEAVW